eukprot:30890-Pelagococcus_subviridis.AAC.9
MRRGPGLKPRGDTWMERVRPRETTFNTRGRSHGEQSLGLNEQTHAPSRRTSFRRARSDATP